MPELCDISYSEDECVAVIRDYYDFITKIYLDRSVIIEPPEGGWPMITPETMGKLGKSDSVTSLLRRLPYIRESESDLQRSQGSAECSFCDWVDQAQDLIAGRDGDDVRGDTEGEDMPDDVPAHVIGLTSGTDSPILLLDTELGIVNWYECPTNLIPLENQFRMTHMIMRQRTRPSGVLKAPLGQSPTFSNFSKISFESSGSFQLVPEGFMILSFIEVQDRRGCSPCCRISIGTMAGRIWSIIARRSVSKPLKKRLSRSFLILSSKGSIDQSRRTCMVLKCTISKHRSRVTLIPIRHNHSNSILT